MNSELLYSFVKKFNVIDENINILIMEYKSSNKNDANAINEEINALDNYISSKEFTIQIGTEERKYSDLSNLFNEEPIDIMQAAGIEVNFTIKIILSKDELYKTYKLEREKFEYIKVDKPGIVDFIENIPMSEHSPVVYIFDPTFERILSNQYITVMNIDSDLNDESSWIKLSSAQINEYSVINNSLLHKNINSIRDLPSYWYFENDFDNMFSNKLIRTFLKLFSFSENIGNEVIEYKFKGNHNLTVQVPISELEIVYNNLTFIDTIFRKVIDENRAYDKMVIVQQTIVNQFGHEVKVNDWLETLPIIFENINDNINLYIKKELDAFINIKKAVIVESIDISKNINLLSEEVSNYLKNLLLATLGVLSASLLLEMDSLNLLVIKILLLGLTGYFCIILFLISSLFFKRKNSISILKRYLESNSKGIPELSYDNLYKSYIEPNNLYFYILFWFSELIIVSLLILCLILFLDVLSNNKFDGRFVNWILMLLRYNGK